jgi:hypothetical protein
MAAGIRLAAEEKEDWMHKVFDANDVAEMQGFRDAADRLRRLPHALGQSQRILPVWSGKVCAGPPVRARIERGRWIADCDAVIGGHLCGGAEWVAPGVPFFCFSCGNASTAGKARPVIFPEPAEKADIEAAILERPMVNMVPAAHPIVQTLSARPELAVDLSGEHFAITRDWNPGEKASELRDQHRMVAELRKSMPSKRGAHGL